MQGPGAGRGYIVSGGRVMPQQQQQIPQPVVSFEKRSFILSFLNVFERWCLDKLVLGLK